MGDHFRVILAVLAALEGLLERLGLVLGRLEGILDGLGGILGASWRSGKRLGNVLGAILASLGSHFGYVWTVLGPKKHVNGGKNPCQEAFPFDFNFGRNFYRFWIVLLGGPAVSKLAPQSPRSSDADLRRSTQLGECPLFLFKFSVSAPRYPNSQICL